MLIGNVSRFTQISSVFWEMHRDYIIDCWRLIVDLYWIHTTGFGPETITAHTIRPGRYRYRVSEYKGPTENEGRLLSAGLQVSAYTSVGVRIFQVGTPDAGFVRVSKRWMYSATHWQSFLSYHRIIVFVVSSKWSHLFQILCFTNRETTGTSSLSTATETRFTPALKTLVEMIITTRRDRAVEVYSLCSICKLIQHTLIVDSTRHCLTWLILFSSTSVWNRLNLMKCPNMHSCSNDLRVCKIEPLASYFSCRL
jgi:hypothetical protein